MSYPTYGGYSVRPGSANADMSRRDIIFQAHRRKIIEIAITRFKWNVHNGIDVRFLEKTLHDIGHIFFYFDGRYDRFMAVQGTVVGPVNQYGNPVRFRTTSWPGYVGVDLTTDWTETADGFRMGPCVPIYNSYLRVTDSDLVNLYANRLTEIDMTMEINTANARHNKVAYADDSNQLSVANVLKQINSGVNVIKANQNFDINAALGVIDMGMDPKIISEIRIERNQTYGNMLTDLGIQNANSDKKERVVEDEANSANGAVIMNRNLAIRPRLEACDMINRLYPGANVSVEWSHPESAMWGLTTDNTLSVTDGAQDDEMENDNG